MTPDQKRLVRETWQQVIPIGETAAELFYGRLFTIDPSTRELFSVTDMTEQRKKLLRMIAVAIAGLDDLDAVLPTVEALGHRHAAYGVADAHFDSVGAALLWTLEQGLGPAWTPTVAAAWTELYGLLSGVMRRACREEADRMRVAA